MTTHIYLIRHGQTTWNTEELVQGVQDIPLTPEGCEQAATAAEKLKDKDFSFAYSSPLTRAKITAGLIAAPHGLGVTEMPGLIERGYGSMEGLPMANWEKFFSEDPQAGGLAEPTEDAESEIAVSIRAASALREISVAHPGRTGFAATHGGVIQAFLRQHFPGQFSRVRPVRDIHNLGYAVILVEDSEFSVEAIEGIDRIARAVLG